MATSPAMTATLDTRRAHRVRQHGDIVAIFTWINDERALVLVPANRPGAPWYVVMEGAAWTWDDNRPENVATVARKALKACEVLGIEPTTRNAVRIAGIVVEALPELIEMPSSQPPDYHKGAFGKMELRADGELILAEDIKVEKEGGASYG